MSSHNYPREYYVKKLYIRIFPFLLFLFLYALSLNATISQEIDSKYQDSYPIEKEVVLVNMPRIKSYDLTSLSEVPILYRGRYLPMSAYCNLWIENNIETNNLPFSGIDFLIRLHFLGIEAYENLPLIKIDKTIIRQLNNIFSSNLISSRELRQSFYSDREKNLSLISPLILFKFFEFIKKQASPSINTSVELTSLSKGIWVKNTENQLKIIRSPNSFPWHFLQSGQTIGQFSANGNTNKLLSEKILSLMGILEEIDSFSSSQSFLEKEYCENTETLINKKINPSQIKKILENRFPLESRLASAGKSFLALPYSQENSKWFSLKCLKLKDYDQKLNQLTPIKNFTTYSNETFKKIQKAYLELETAIQTNQSVMSATQILASSLLEGYQTLEGKSYKESTVKALTFPSLTQLKIEHLYYNIPFTIILFYGYLLSSLLLIITKFKVKKRLFPAAIIFSIFIFTIHTSALVLRCYILSRPPVSNMAETVLFVPWIGIIVSYILALFYKSLTPIIVGLLNASALMLILKFSGCNLNLENVQAVLDSQFWLTIHVLMVVGSYGVFILSGILGHYYLYRETFCKSSKENLQKTGKLIIQSIYIGLSLLIPGTILGGIWAAQSWGRFWDWDPKESWAFISSCVYLICVHAHYFKLISNFGISIGAIIGLMVIGFTWYGVNYILGSGLHSYGFGSGGEIFFYSYVLTEIFFLVLILYLRYNRAPSHVMPQ